MSEIHFPPYEEDSFKYSYYINEILSTINRSIISLDEVKRNYCLNYTEKSDQDKDEFIKKYSDIYNDTNYYFQEFYIREKCNKFKFKKLNNSDTIICYHYYLSKWNKKSKRENIDDRILTVNIYVENTKTNEEILDLSYKIFVAHKNFILDEFVDIISNKYNFKNTIPLYFSTNNSNYKSFAKHNMNKINIKDEISLIFIIERSLRFYNAQNYIFSKIIKNQRIKVMNEKEYKKYKKESSSNIKIVTKEYNATEDKYVSIDLGNKLYLDTTPEKLEKLSTIIKKKNENIIVKERRKCDHQVQVPAHTQGYWVKGKDGLKHKVYVEKQSYTRNKDKPYKIIHEIEPII